jgi:stalled ribosome rescue protein Dom34
MTTFHAVVWLDHQEAHVLMFDREHMQTQRIKSRTHHKHQGKSADHVALFADIAKALHGTHEVLVTGPGKARDEFRDWVKQHDAAVVAMARQYFKNFDQMAADPAVK